MSEFQNEYQIYKLPSELLAENGLSLDGYGRRRAALDGNLVSIGDNIVLRQIRKMRGRDADPAELFARVQTYRQSARRYRAAGRPDEARALERALSDELFVPEIVNVRVGRKSDYRRMAVRGFDLNGAHYTRLCCGSGQMRRNTITFVDARLWPELNRRLMCGLDDGRIASINMAKFHAYYALAFSSILWVREPRVVVVPDCQRTLPKEPVDFITDDPATGEHRIERREVDWPLNLFDGQGLIDPAFAALWAEDMRLDYVPCSFVARSCFVKGNLAEFDFKALAAERGIAQIRDRWGMPHPVADVDAILSESQFKMVKYYSSWEEYLAKAESADVGWGVARYSRREDAPCALMNYQYVQPLELPPEGVAELARPTCEWLRGVGGGDPLYQSLFAFGRRDPERTLARDLVASSPSAWAKAAAKDPDLLADPYVRRRLYRSAKECARRAKVGKVWVRGNYEFAVADPYAQAQWALGLEPTGLLGPGEVWSAFWAANGRPARVAMLRSPMIDQHEIGVQRPLYGSAEADRWYSHLYSGWVFNVRDSSTGRYSDSDFDGDVLLSTDSPEVIAGAHPAMPIVTYAKGAAPSEAPSPEASARTDLRGLGTGVGGFSNLSTVIYAKEAEYAPGSPQRLELERRRKELREIVGQEIDRIKGTARPKVPERWRRLERAPEGASAEERRAVAERNALCLTKKPYFMRYRYPELDARYRAYERQYDRLCRALFGMPLRAVEAVPRARRTPEMRKALSDRARYCPLIVSPCTMNLLCREVERADGEASWPRGGDGPSMLPALAAAALPGPLPADPARDAALLSAYRVWKSRRQERAAARAYAGSGADGSPSPEVRALAMDEESAAARAALGALAMGAPECALRLAALEGAPGAPKRIDWAFLWEVLPEGVVAMAPMRGALVAAPDPNGRETPFGRLSLRRLDPADDRAKALDRWARRQAGDEEIRARTLPDGTVDWEAVALDGLREAAHG